MKSTTVICIGDFSNHLTADKPIVPIKGQKYTIVESMSGSDETGTFTGYIFKEIPVYVGIKGEKRYWNAIAFEFIDGSFDDAGKPKENEDKPNWVVSKDIKERKPFYMV